MNKSNKNRSFRNRIKEIVDDGGGNEQQEQIKAEGKAIRFYSYIYRSLTTAAQIPVSKIGLSTAETTRSLNV